jgi:hypothetical protein
MQVGKRQLTEPILKVRKVRENNRSSKQYEFDPDLFPIRIPPEFYDEQLSQLVIPPILRSKFDQHSITRLGHLDGMTRDQLLAWPGFGWTFLGALCHMLSSMKVGQLKRLPLPKSETIRASELPHEVLEFDFEMLNLSTLFKSHIRNQLGVRTVSSFLQAYESGKLSRPYFGGTAIEQAYREIATLEEIGSERYIKEVSLESRSFLQLIEAIRERLSPRERIIFDHRFCPLTDDLLTLEVLGRQLDLTRERVRQIEKALVKQLQSGLLRELGWLVRRKVIALFAPQIDRLDFHTLLDNSFFAGCPWTTTSTPAPFVFLDMVFYSTFSVDKSSVSLNEAIQRRRNFT